MKPCPFCGFQVEDHVDMVYPSGIYWMFVDGYKSYMNFQSSLGHPGCGICYQVFCNPVMGGCGANMTGDSKEEAIENWDRRV